MGEVVQFLGQLHAVNKFVKTNVSQNNCVLLNPEFYNDKTKLYNQYSTVL